MSTDPHDVEYGPNPPGAAYEHTDIDPGVGYRFGAWLLVAMLISGAIVFGTFRLLQGRVAARDEAAARYPMAAGQTREPPAPRLQTQPFKDVYQLRRTEAERLNGYGWVDQATGVVHIPIDRAMALAIERGVLAVRPEGGAQAQLIPQDSSGGRTMAGR